MILISETLGNNNWPPKSPTPLKSPTQTMGPKRYRSSAHCVNSELEKRTLLGLLPWAQEIHKEVRVFKSVPQHEESAMYI